jgi:hypothetical protein
MERNVPPLLIAAGIAALLGTIGGAYGYHALAGGGQRPLTPEQEELLRQQREAEAHTQQLRIGLAAEQILPVAVLGMLGAAGIGAFLLWKSREQD